MKKPNNFDNTQAQGEFVPVELGGHYLVIKEVVEMQSKTGKDMVKVSFDFAKNDKQPEYFEKMFRDDIRPEKKWPNQAAQYILTEDNEGNCSRAFKTFITCVEHSNKGFKTQWGNKFEAQFKNKSIGGVFGPQMDYYDGREKEKRVLRWFISIDKVAEADVPDMSETRAYKEHIGACRTGFAPTDDGFMNIPDGVDEELPFN
ncbi:hypothetical protein OCV51_13015 [Faecalicatena acetigenes]|uniref:DUF669 domain-containing protein n=1 Tax=Faecalicatena acetigenes TaxID=2981790 RepID=A0ABT2TE66_9FIRM|nr:hypothetical protein [Faecalicatena acetigenes]MCU6748562.1 hypothetical protein [Faecalicatena acetigenes]SCI51235.1 Uncharacterised protein [uncultured Clostridium sp.]